MDSSVLEGLDTLHRLRALYRRMDHVSDEVLELYCLDRITDESALTQIEEHLLVCRSCIERTEATQRQVDTILGVLYAAYADVPPSEG